MCKGGGDGPAGWRAQHSLAAALPDAWVQSSSGTTYRLATA